MCTLHFLNVLSVAWALNWVEFKDVYNMAVPPSRLYEERIECSNDALVSWRHTELQKDEKNELIPCDLKQRVETSLFLWSHLILLFF